jgi:hypothetical protein
MWLPLKLRFFAHCCGHLTPAPNDWVETNEVNARKVKTQLDLLARL